MMLYHQRAEKCTTRDFWECYLIQIQTMNNVFSSEICKERENKNNHIWPGSSKIIVSLREYSKIRCTHSVLYIIISVTVIFQLFWVLSLDSMCDFTPYLLAYICMCIRYLYWTENSEQPKQYTEHYNLLSNFIVCQTSLGPDGFGLIWSPAALNFRNNQKTLP